MAHRDYSLLPSSAGEVELEVISPTNSGGVRNRKKQSSSPPRRRSALELSSRDEFINERNKRIARLKNLKGQYLQVSTLDHSSEDFSEELFQTCVEALIVCLFVGIIAAFMELGFLLTIIVIGALLFALTLAIYLLWRSQQAYYVIEVIAIFLMAIFVSTAVYRLVFTFTLSKAMPWLVTACIVILAIFSVVLMTSIANITNAAKHAKVVRLQRIAHAKYEQK